jgi:hypothetical protein
MVAHTCNPCYLGGRDRKDSGPDQPRQKSRDPLWKISKAKRAGRSYSFGIELVSIHNVWKSMTQTIRSQLPKMDCCVYTQDLGQSNCTACGYGWFCSLLHMFVSCNAHVNLIKVILKTWKKKNNKKQKGLVDRASAYQLWGLEFKLQYC